MYYVIQVQTGDEQKTIDDIHRFNTNRSEMFDVFSPFRKVRRKYGKEYRDCTERCFPGYIFVETDDVEQLFKDLYWVPSFTKLLGRSSKNSRHFVPLQPEEEQMINILYNRHNGRVTPLSTIEIEEGDKIRVIDGPLMDLKAKVVKKNLHKRKITIGLTICEQYVETEIGIDLVIKEPKQD